MPEIALYQPDIPQNTGTILRMSACFGLPVHIIEPTGFALSDRTLRRAGMDYLDRANLIRHISWDAFEAWREAAQRRLVLLTTHARRSYAEFEFEPDDILLFGRESAGVPEPVHACADARLKIPMRAETRSLNLAVAAAMVTGEALRQTAAFPSANENQE